MESYFESFEDENSLYSDPSIDLTFDSDDIVLRRFICYIDDLPPNTLGEFYFEDQKILLARQRGKVYAVGTTCTHKGDKDPSLLHGSLGRTRIRCAACGSCYNLATGEIEVFPTLIPLQCYKVYVEEKTKVFVTMRPRDIIGTSDYQVRLMPNLRYRSTETYAIIGGGPAAALCMEYLRKLGFTGKVITFMKEDELPYDRSMLTKQLHVLGSSLQLRSREFYQRLEVDVFPSISVTHVSLTDNTLVRSDGGLASFDKVFIATGCEAKRLSADIPGATDATGIFYFRTLSDARNIQAALSKDIDLVVVGSGFLGMEVAVVCLPYVKSVTVVGQTEYPFQKTFGPAIGEAILKLCSGFGVVMKMNSKILRIEMNNDTLAMTGVILRSEEFIPAQMAIVCIGVTLTTQLLEDTSIEMTSGGGVRVNEYLTTNIPYVFAGGDIAFAPLHSYFNTTTTSRHYQVAMIHGRAAAANMVGIARPLRTIPFINVTIGHIVLKYVGHIKHVEHMDLVGSLSDFKFAAYYLDGDRVIAIVCCGLDSLAAKFAETIFMGKSVTRDSLDDHAWSRRVFTCTVHDRDEDYKLDLVKLKQMGLVF